MEMDLKNKPSSPVKKKRMPVWAIVIIVCAIVGVIVLLWGFSASVWGKYARIQSAQSSANALYTPSSNMVSGGEIVSDTSEAVDPATGVISDFNKLYAKNPDVVGHLSIPGTKLSTVVVQGKDNEYYLNHNFFKESVLGVPFVDYRATISQDYMDNNITVYGHSARDGSYFAPLKQYRTADYVKQHPNVVFDTIYRKGQYKIFAAFIAKVTTDSTKANQNDPEIFDYQNYTNMSEDEFNTFYAEVMKRSYFTTGVDVNYGDQLLTMSTCDDQIDSSTTTPYRMVVIARQVRVGESTNVDTSEISSNKDMIMPKAWTAKYHKSNPYQ